MRYICASCGSLFDIAKHYTERLPNDDVVVDEWDGCPYCSSDLWFTARKCAVCGEYFWQGYKTKDDDYICDNCIEPI